MRSIGKIVGKIGVVMLLLTVVRAGCDLLIGQPGSNPTTTPDDLDDGNDSGSGGSPDTIALEFLGVTQIGGVDGVRDSTALELSFDINPATLAADDITVFGATKGALSGSETTRTLAISGITVPYGDQSPVAAGRYRQL